MLRGSTISTWSTQLFAFFALLSFGLSPVFSEETSTTKEYVAQDVMPVLSYAPARRKEQFTTSAGYAIFPYPYSLPGVGEGLGLVGGIMNVNETYTDVYGILLGGEVEGVAGGIADIHIIPKRLIFDAGFSDISAVQIMSFSGRGMYTDKDDFRLLELSDAQYYGGRLTATFYDRRLEFYGGWYKGASQLENIRDKDGNIIIAADESSRDQRETRLLGIRLDLTDDYADPRQGFRLDITRSSSPPENSGPDFYVMDYNMTAYLPMGKRSTWAFNFLQSDAVVRRAGETDPLALQIQNGINCADPALTTQEQEYCLEVINNTIAHNTVGSATGLGGFSRLRSYPQGRFSGAHTQFIGTEFRWNVTDETTPFDIFIMKDIRTAVQVAFFFEMGSAADSRGEVGDRWRNTFGVGFRMVTASGAVFRGDFSYGQEGFEPQIFIGYPWEI